MGLRITVNSAMAVSLSVMFFALLGCALTFLVGLFRLTRQGKQGQGGRWIAWSLGVGLVLLAVTPLMRPGLGLLGRWASRGEVSLISVEKYRAVRAGMTHEEVEGLVGSVGVEGSRTEQSGFSMAVYQWDNPDGSYMQVTFNNGLVTTKSQLGLSH